MEEKPDKVLFSIILPLMRAFLSQLFERCFALTFLLLRQKEIC